MVDPSEHWGSVRLRTRGRHLRSRQKLFPKPGRRLVQCLYHCPRIGAHFRVIPWRRQGRRKSMPGRGLSRKCHGPHGGCDIQLLSLVAMFCGRIPFQIRRLEMRLQLSIRFEKCYFSRWRYWVHIQSGWPMPDGIWWRFPILQKFPIKWSLYPFMV